MRKPLKRVQEIRWWLGQILLLPMAESTFCLSNIHYNLLSQFRLCKISLSQPPLQLGVASNLVMAKLKNEKFAFPLKWDKYGYLHLFSFLLVLFWMWWLELQQPPWTWSKAQKSQRDIVILLSLWNITSSHYVCTFFWWGNWISICLTHS